MDTILQLIREVGQNGKGYTESIYQEAVCIRLRDAKIKYTKEAVHNIYFDSQFVGFQRSDIIIPEMELIIECKATDSLRESSFLQIINYMKSMKYPNGIIVNFNQNISKEFDEIFTVTYCNNEYDFENYYTKEIISISEKGKLLEPNYIEYIKENIYYDKGAVLTSNDCKILYEKLPLKQKNSKYYNLFITCVEKHCNDTFKLTQKEYIKSSTIKDYMCKK